MSSNLCALLSAAAAALAALVIDIFVGDAEVYMDTMKVFIVVQGVCRMSGLLIVAFCISFDFMLLGTRIASTSTLGALITFFSLFDSPNPPTLDAATASADSPPRPRTSRTSSPG